MRETATEIFRAALAAVSPETCVNRSLRLCGDTLQAAEAVYDLSSIRRLFLIGAGKASAAMAAEAEALLGDRIYDGLIITKYGHGTPLNHCRLMEAGHPVPDANGCRAADTLLELVGTAGPDDLILCLISGGGSALTPAPAAGISLADKQETTRLLLACGATIHEINTIRKHLSRIKGGRLSRAANGAAVVSLILSDVIGDDLDIIASGPTVPDTSTFQDCLAILSKHNLQQDIPAPVRRHLVEGAAGRREETPKPDDAGFSRVTNRIIGSISDALSAAEKKAAFLGYRPLILTSMLHGEARIIAGFLADIAREIRRSGRPISAPACLLSGGETTVTVTGNGRGGRNCELALAAGIELSGTADIVLLSAGTDGTDGPTDAAGAFADGSTLARAGKLGISAATHLADNDSYTFFEPLQDLLITGPTRTNVMDIQIVLIR